MTEQDAVVDYVPMGPYIEPEPKAYQITIRPEPGTKFVIKHFGRWYLQDRADRFFGPYESDLHALLDDDPTGGRVLEELPKTSEAGGN